MPTFVDLATNIFQLHGMPLEMPYESMRHLWPIYNRADNEVLLKFGRQTHKSTTLSYKITLPCLRYHDYHSVYVAPTGNQVSVFSTDKLDNALRGSDFIQKYYVDSRTKDQIQYKELCNRSLIYLRSAFHSADSIRGISADQTNIDEMQDILSDHIPVIEQCMGFSLAKWEQMKKKYPELPMHLFNHKLYAGTPKTIENTLEIYWAQSTQNEWLIKCEHCNKWNYINEKNVGPTCLICNKCGLPIYYKNGQWVTMNNDGFIQGYRLPQIILDWVNNPRNEQAWQINVMRPMRIYTSQRFFNEILALPHSSAKNPLNLQDIKNACQDYPMAVTPDDLSFCKGNDMFAGIDWGKGDTARGTSYTILTIGCRYMDKFKTVFIKKYMGRESEASFQWRDILRLINYFKCKFVIADTGDGRTSNAELVNAIGPHRFAECYEHGRQKKKIKWDKNEGIYIINRTRMMTDRFMEIKRGQLQFFNYEQFKKYKDDFLSIYLDYSEKTRLSIYDHTAPDDAFHSLMFCRIANMVHTGELNKYLAGGDDDPDLHLV